MDLSRVEIPAPSIGTQQKVVDILDRFGTLTKSLTDGRINPHEYMNRPADSNEDWRVTARGDGPASVILRAMRIESDLSWYKLLAGSRGFQGTAYVYV